MLARSDGMKAPMTTITDDEGKSSSCSFNSPLAARQSENGRHYGSRPTPTYVVTPVVATPTPARFSPTSAATPGDGLFHRPKRSPTGQTPPLCTTPSPTNHIPKSSPSSPLSPSAKSGNRRKNVVMFLVLLLVACMCVTLSFTFYLLNQVQKSATIGKSHPRIHSSDAEPRHNNETTSNAVSNLGPRKGFEMKPRLVYLEYNHGFSKSFHKRPLADDPTLHAPPGQEAVPQDGFDRDYHHDDNCVFQSDWQTSSFPNCNTVHELELRAAGPDVGSHVGFEDNVTYMGRGWFRAAWEVNIGATNETVALKTLRSEREFYSEYYELHRRDAVAMERLTFSPFVLDIYGFCGHSALNEMASFSIGGLTSLEKFDRQLRGKESKQAYFVKLQIATSVAVGVAHVHQVNGADAIPSLVHYDLNPRNIAIVKGGKPKLNDFNTAEFLRVNLETNETCGFPSRLHEPWWRAPEEVIKPKRGEVSLVTEKADVYSLGNILHHILTTHSPRGKMRKDRMEKVRKDVAFGRPPVLHKKYLQSKDPAIIAFTKAMKMCFARDPDKRASSTEVAGVLLDALMDIRKNDPDRTKIKK